MERAQWLLRVRAAFQVWVTDDAGSRRELAGIVSPNGAHGALTAAYLRRVHAGSDGIRWSA